MPIRIVDDCCGLGTASTALQLALKGDDFKIEKVEASESDFCLRHWIKKNLGFKRVIKDCNDKRRFLETGNGRKKEKITYTHQGLRVNHGPLQETTMDWLTHAALP